MNPNSNLILKSVIEELTFSKNQIKELKIAHPLHSIHSDIFKSTMVMFLSEVLHFSIHEEEKNEPFFEFIETRLHWLDHNDKFNNFHLFDP